MAVDGLTITLTLQLDLTNLLKHPKFLLKTHTTVRGLGRIYWEYTVQTTERYTVFFMTRPLVPQDQMRFSLLDYLINRLQNELGRHDHLIIWSDNAPGQFKECYLFFYLDYIVRLGQFLRADFKFLLEGHTYFVGDRRFGTIHTLFKKREIIAIPRKWATVLEESKLSNVEVCWVTLAMIKDFKSFLQLWYVSQNEDIEKQRFEVKNIAWLNFGYGEEVDNNEELQLVPHPESVFVRFQINPKEVPWKISFVKKKQATELRPEFTTLREERKPVHEDVKSSAQKYLSLNAVCFLPISSVDGWTWRRLWNAVKNCFSEKVC